MSHDFAVVVVASGLIAFGIDVTSNHVVPALEPNEASEFVTSISIVIGIDAFDVGQDLLHVFKHQSVVVAGGCNFVGFDLRDVLLLLFELRDLFVAEHEWASAWWSEVCVDALAAPRGLDDQNRFTECLVRVDTECEFGANLWTAAFCAEADG